MHIEQDVNRAERGWGPVREGIGEDLLADRARRIAGTGHDRM